jgi:hypothetical protein
VTATDWRFRGQERDLVGSRLRHTPYRAPSPSWDHDHCAFCWRKLAEQGDAARAGWQTEDERQWICDECFADLREPLGFVVTDESTPARGVELHDARVLEVIARAGGFIRLEAFVHDDAASASGAGCWQRIDLLFGEATFEQKGSGEPRVLDGSVKVGDRVHENVLPIPFNEAGEVVATMAGTDFELTVRAKSVWLRVAGAPGEREG